MLPPWPNPFDDDESLWEELSRAAQEQLLAEEVASIPISAIPESPVRRPTRGALVPFDQTAKPRSQQHERMVSAILNSLLRRGQLLQVDQTDWSLGYFPDDTDAWSTIPTTVAEALDYLVSYAGSATDLASLEATVAAIAPVFTAPDSASFSWRNQGGASVSGTSSVLLTAPANAGSSSLRIREKATPATPYTLTAYLDIAFNREDYANAGLCLVESGTGEVITFGTDSEQTLRAIKWNSVTSYNADYRRHEILRVGHFPRWFRITDTGATRSFSTSPNGTDFVEFYSGGRTDFLTADKIGWFCDSENTFPVLGRLSSWAFS